MISSNGTNLRWFQTWWGIVLMGLAGLVAVVLIIFLVLTGKYWWAIKHGQGKALEQTFYGNFQSSVKGSTSTKIDRVKLEAVSSPFLGSPNAPITIVAFFDYKCPNSKAAAPIIQKLINKYGFKARVIIRNFPGESIHTGASKLSEIAACTYLEQPDKFWGLYNILFAKQDQLPAQLTDQDIAVLTDNSGLDYAKLNQCLQSGAGKVKANKDYADGFDAGVSGTPTFFVNGEMVEGVVPFDIWENFVKNY